MKNQRVSLVFFLAFYSETAKNINMNQNQLRCRPI